MGSESRKSNRKWSTVETSGKLYLFAEHSMKEYDNTKGYYTSGPIPGRPMSKNDCLRLARILLNHATS
jgi:hypothetical protein